jgi:hypothetical protein
MVSTTNKSGINDPVCLWGDESSGHLHDLCAVPFSWMPFAPTKKILFSQRSLLCPPLILEGVCPPLILEGVYPPLILDGVCPPLILEGVCPPLILEGVCPPLILEGVYHPLFPEGVALW